MKYLKFLLAVFSLLFLSSAHAQDFDLKSSMERGKIVYKEKCASCHMINGTGLSGSFPPLAKSENLSDKNRLINIVVKGMKGPIKSKGMSYEGIMPGYKLSDQQISDVLNYMLNSWGNSGAPVLPKDVQPALKMKIKNYQPSVQ